MLKFRAVASDAHYLDHPTAEQFNHGLQAGDSAIDKGVLLVNATFEYTGMEMRVPPEHIPGRLV